MANRAAGEMEITIAGKSYTLRPSFTCIMDFEERAGMSVFEALRAVGERQSVPIKNIVASFHAGMKAAWKPSMGKMPTFEEVGQGVREDGITDHLTNYMTFLANMMTGERALDEAQKRVATEGNAPPMT